MNNYLRSLWWLYGSAIFYSPLMNIFFLMLRLLTVYCHSFTWNVDTLIENYCHYQYNCVGVLLLPEAVRNCILGYVCYVDWFTVLDILLHLCIYENMIIYGSLKVRQTYLISPYSNICWLHFEHTIRLHYDYMPLDFGLTLGAWPSFSYKHAL